MFNFAALINSSEADRLLKTLDESGPKIRRVAANAAAIVTRDHLTKIAGQRHRGGRFNYYGEASSKTVGRVVGDDIVLSLSHRGIGLRFFGGTVRPKPGNKYLTIPANEETEGKSARDKEFKNELFFFRNKTGTAGLAKRGERKLRVMYWLVKKTEHKPDPSVLPTSDEYIKAIKPVVEFELMRAANQN